MSELVHPHVIPIPIRDGVAVRVHLPPDITKAEAEKVARVIVAYAESSKGDHHG